MKYFIHFILILIISNTGWSQSDIILTFDKAVNIALQKSYTIKTFEQERMATQYAYRFYKAMFKPRLDFNIDTPSWNEQVVPIQRPDGLPVYNSVGSMRFSGDLAFTYTLPTGGHLALSSTLYRDDISTSLALKNYEMLKTNKAYSRLAISFNQPILTTNTLRENLDRAQYTNERAGHQFTRGQMDIIYNVTKGFYQLYRESRKVDIGQERLKNAEEALRIARIKAETGRSPEIDVLISQVDLAKSQASLSESQNELAREKDYFKQLIGLDLEQEIKIITDLKYDTFQIDLDKALSSALDKRLELKEANLDIKLQKVEIDRAKRYTELKGNISAYYDFTGVSSINSHSTRELFESSFNNFIERKPNRGITLTLSYPIFDWSRGAMRVEEETALLRKVELDKNNTRQTIIREVRDVVRSVREAKSRLKIFEQNQQVAEMTYRISQMRFENGDINSQALALEQERLATSQLAYLDAYITYQLALADLKRKTLWDFKNNISYLKTDLLSQSSGMNN